MIRINLLPHREEKRARRQQQTYLLLGVTALAGVVIVIMTYTALAGRIESQTDRNQFLDKEIAKLDIQIEEIKKLKEQTQGLLARKQVVESLQTNRAEAVHLLDQLLRLLPDGVYLKSVKETSLQVQLTGYAQSNARVSSLMRNLASSAWLENPELIEIKAATVNNVRANEFTLNVKLKRQTAEELPSAARKDKKV